MTNSRHMIKPKEKNRNTAANHIAGVPGPGQISVMQRGAMATKCCVCMNGEPLSIQWINFDQ